MASVPVLEVAVRSGMVRVLRQQLWRKLVVLPGALSVTSTFAPLLMVTVDPVTGLMPVALLPVKLASSLPKLPRVSVLVNVSGEATSVPLMTEGVAMMPVPVRRPALVETVRLPPVAMEPSTTRVPALMVVVPV